MRGSSSAAVVLASMSTVSITRHNENAVCCSLFACCLISTRSPLPQAAESAQTAPQKVDEVGATRHAFAVAHAYACVPMRLSHRFCCQHILPLLPPTQMRDAAADTGNQAAAKASELKDKAADKAGEVRRRGGWRPHANKGMAMHRIACVQPHNVCIRVPHPLPLAPLPLAVFSRLQTLPRTPAQHNTQVSGRAQESAEEAKQSTQEALDHTKARAQETADTVSVLTWRSWWWWWCAGRLSNAFTRIVALWRRQHVATSTTLCCTLKNTPAPSGPSLLIILTRSPAACPLPPHVSSNPPTTHQPQPTTQTSERASETADKVSSQAQQTAEEAKSTLSDKAQQVREGAREGGSVCYVWRGVLTG